MRLLVALLVLAPLQERGPETGAPPRPEPWSAPLAEGLAELRAAVDSEQREAVLELAGRLGRSAREVEPDASRAARVLHDVGLARAAVDDLEGALDDLRAAAGLAGPGDVRASAMYAAGTARLERAELLRLAVPEIAEELGLPAPPQPAEEDAAAPDPLDLARQAYLDARADLLERLRLDARDEDTRANLELVTRRLRELDDIEREREEQQEDQQQEQDPDPEQEPDPEQQPPEDQQPSEDQQQDPEQQQQEQQDPSDELREPEPDEQESDEEEEQQQDQQEQPPEESESEESEEQQEPQPQPATEGELEERVLSKEEVQRLLDQLAEIEAEAEAVRARLRDRRRKPVEKDW